MRRRRTYWLLGIAAVPAAVVAGIGIYLLSLAGDLPWQTDPTPISAGVTPFANLPTPTGVAASPVGGTPAASSSPIASPVVSPAASPAAVAPPGGSVWAIVAEASEVRYRVREKLAGFATDNDAVGATSAIIGEVVLGADGLPVPGWTFQVDLRTLKSDKVRRDNDIKKHFLETDEHPIATFVVTAVEGLSGPLAIGQATTVAISGEMTAHGVTHPVTWETTVTLQGDTLSGSATTTFNFEDFGMPVPNIAGMVSARNPIKLEFDFVAKKVA